MSVVEQTLALFHRQDAKNAKLSYVFLRVLGAFAVRFGRCLQATPKGETVVKWLLPKLYARKVKTSLKRRDCEVTKCSPP